MDRTLYVTKHRHMKPLFAFALAVVLAAAASPAVGQPLPEDPESLVELLASKSRPPLLRRLTEQERKEALATIELLEGVTQKQGGTLSKIGYELLDDTLGPGVLDHLRGRALH